MRPRTVILLAFLLASLCAQAPIPGSPNDSAILKTPDGRNRTEMILKADHEASLKDMEQMRKLVEEVRMEMEKNDRHVLSIGTVKKLDEIEKLAKRVKGRMKRF